MLCSFLSRKRILSRLNCFYSGLMYGLQINIISYPLVPQFHQGRRGLAGFYVRHCFVSQSKPQRRLCVTGFDWLIGTGHVVKQCKIFSLFNYEFISPWSLRCTSLLSGVGLCKCNVFKITPSCVSIRGIRQDVIKIVICSALRERSRVMNRTTSRPVFWLTWIYVFVSRQPKKQEMVRCDELIRRSPN